MLRQALLINFVFSVGSAIIILLFMGMLQNHIPLPGPIWVVISVGLLGFAVLLLVIVTRVDQRGAWVKTVFASDILWIALTMLGLLIFAGSLTMEGVLLVLLVNMVVGLLAYMTHWGRKLVV